MTKCATVQWTPDLENQFGQDILCVPYGHTPFSLPSLARSASFKDAVITEDFRFDPSTVKSSEYDPLSIMHYPIPKDFTTDGFVVGWNNHLSEKDIQFIKTIYPRANPSFSIGKAKAGSMDKAVEVGTTQTVQA